MSRVVRILLLNQYFHPDVAASAQRISELAEDLATAHTVTAIVGRPSYDPAASGADPGPIRRVRIRRVWSTRFPRYRAWQRVANYLSYLAASLVAAVFSRRPDVVVAGTDPPLMAFVGLLASRVHRVPFVHLLWDVQPHVAIAAGALDESPMTRLMARGHRAALRGAARVIVPTAAMGRTALAHGARPAAVVEIPHWEDTALVSPGPKDNPFSRAHGLADRFVVMYSGNIGLTQRLDRYLDLAERLKDLADLTLVFIGEGAGKRALEDRARDLSGARVLCLPYQPRNTMAQSFAAADVCLAPIGPGLTPFMLPSKVFTIMASGRPVLAAIDLESDLAATITRTGCGRVIAPGDMDAAERELRWFHANVAERANMGRLARRAAEEQFSRTTVTPRFLDVLSALDRDTQS